MEHVDQAQTKCQPDGRASSIPLTDTLEGVLAGITFSTRRVLNLHDKKNYSTSTAATGIPRRTPSKSHDDHGNFDGCHHLPAVLLAYNYHPPGLFNHLRVDCVKSRQLRHWQPQLSPFENPTRNPYQDFTAFLNRRRRRP